MRATASDPDGWPRRKQTMTRSSTLGSLMASFRRSRRGGPAIAVWGGLSVLALSVLQACSPLTAANTAFVGSGMTAAADVSYADGARRMLDVYAPEEAQNAPVVVFFYGGSWRNGQRSQYRFVGDTLARRGIVTVIPDYRLYPDVQFPLFVEDGAKAVAWVRDHIAAYGGDPDRIVLAGHSAGAHIAALLALDDGYLQSENVDRRAIRGMLGMAGPYGFDLLTLASTRPIFETVGDDRDKAIPTVFVSSAAPPMVLLHGRDDDTVEPANTQDLAGALRDSGVPVDVFMYDGVGHVGLLAGLFPIPGVPSEVTGDVADGIRRLVLNGERIDADAQ